MPRQQAQHNRNWSTVTGTIPCVYASCPKVISEMTSCSFSALLAAFFDLPEDDLFFAASASSLAFSFAFAFASLSSLRPALAETQNIRIPRSSKFSLCRPHCELTAQFQHTLLQFLLIVWVATPDVVQVQTNANHCGHRNSGENRGFICHDCWWLFFTCRNVFNKFCGCAQPTLCSSPLVTWTSLWNFTTVNWCLNTT